MTMSPQLEDRIQRRRTMVRDEFIDAARAVVEEHGFQGFSLDLVGRKVGLRKQAIYHYFDSKEAVLFEVIHAELSRACTAVDRAVDATTSGADAVEALVRTYFGAFRSRTRLFQLSHTALPSFDLSRLLSPERLARLRPLNDLLLAGVATRVARDRGPRAETESARRFAFVAYTSVVGLLAMKALVESADDPLLHRDDPMLDDLVATYRLAAAQRSTR